MTGKRATRLIACALALVVVALAASCGGSGSGNKVIGGIDGGGVVLGAITGFGSIFVNGVEYRTSSAQITINGQSGTESQLRAGEVVSVRATLDAGGKTGTAQSVNFDDNVTGPILSIDLAGQSLVVLGQMVHVNGTTTFDDASNQPLDLATLRVGDVVEVSGFVDASGAVVATRIERKAAGGGLEVDGVVANLDSNAKRFQLNALIVDYSRAQLSNGAPTNGACVEVKGDSTGFSGGVLTATGVEVKGCQEAVADGDLGEIEGLITALRSASDFDVAGRRVSTTGSTQFEGGTASELAPNVKVEVEGTFNTAGTLVASHVEIKQASELRATGTIDTLNAATSTLTIFGITVTTNMQTRFEDNSSQPVSPFNFSSLAAGNYVEVRGFPGATANSITATILERRNPDTRTDLRGVAGNLAPPAFTILGVTVVTDAGTIFENADGGPMTSAEFFAPANDGRLVETEGSWNGSSFTATKVEFKNP